MLKLFSSQNSIDKLSLIDQPGCITAEIPDFFANSTQSGNGKKASDAITDSAKSNLNLFKTDLNSILNLSEIYITSI